MAYTSLYRRFRPDTFEKIVRQEHVVRILVNQIEGGSVGHAYLFTGPRGTGKTSVARIFARAVNCEHPVHGSPCGTCPTCLALAGGSLDITEIDAASNNGVAEMRDLREKVQYPPVSGKYKVYIVDEVHMLTDSAFNALLKTLEEPPAHVIFILATTEPQKLPATILSRCMRLDFKLIPEEDLERHLKSVLDEIGKKYEPAAVAAIARAGAGSDRDMLSVAEMCVAYGDTLTYENVVQCLGAADFHETCVFVRALLRPDPDEGIATVERLLSEGKSVGNLCRDTLGMLGRVSVAKTCRTAEKLLSLPKELFDEVKHIADEADGRAVLRATEIFARAETELRFTSSPRILFETAVLRCACPSIECDTDALAVRISVLEKQLKDIVSGVVITKAPAEEPSEVVSETPSEAPAIPSKTTEPAVKEAQDVPNVQPAPPEEDVPPPEEPAWSMEESPFPPAGPVPERKEEPKPSIKPEPSEGQPLSAEQAFGKFLRLLRKTAKNGVLFTLCSDLSPRFEGSRLVLETTSDTVFRSLSRPEHGEVMKEAFAGVGVQEFEVRSARGEGASRDALDELKRNFQDYPIDIK